MAETIVLVTGGFDPIHSGHIAYFKSARMLGDRLIVGVNSDEWLIQKKGSAFLPLNERIEIVSNLSVVDEVIEFEDDEYNSSANAITTILKKYPNHKIIFANGGDRNSENIPEMKIHSQNPNIHFEFSVGGDFKKNSSSWILKNWQGPKDERPWGWYRIIDDSEDHKVKEIQVNSKSRLSLQSHSKRSEVWVVIKGEATVTVDENISTLNVNDSIYIPTGSKHRLENKLNEPLHIIEIQTGSYFGEDDIQRYEDDYNRA
jgi:cytidyltransferase-like protein|tara:strand:- start:2221 stop:2997 length:777 start_codon:yes stop_codon:yes gene_type:complete